jgi:uncharacterized membrane protein
MKILKNLIPLFFVLLSSVFSIIPFLHFGFFPIHDSTQVQRVFEMTKALTDGMFPVRWVADLGFGYGYPIFSFYAPLSYYLGSIINLLGFDALLATKIMMVLGILIAGVSMYFFAKEIWGKSGAVLSALLYVFVPYHAVDVFVRGDVAEFWAYALIPFIFYGLLGVHKTGKFRFVLIGAFSFAGIIMSHNLTAMMITPFVLLFAMLLFIGNKKTGVNFLLTLFFGIMLSAFYWLPALTEINLTNVFSQIGGGADYKDHFVCLSQLWSSPWGFGGSTKGCVDGLSFMIGKLHIILFIISILISGLCLKLKIGESKKIIMIVFFSIVLFISVFLTLESSKFIWDLLRPMSFFQYPWRFLLPTAFFISIIAGSSFYYLESISKNKWVNILILLILSLTVVGFNYKYFNAQEYVSVSENSFINQNYLKFNTSQISSEYMPKHFKKPENITQIPNFNRLSTKDLAVTVVRHKTQEIEFKLAVKKEGKYTFPIAYFPAWKASLDAKEIQIKQNENGITVNLPSGPHILKFVFIQTPIELFSDIITLTGILIIILGIILRKKLL